jgi:hypothetical protein
MRFHASWSLSQTLMLQNSWGVGVVGEELMQRHECEIEFGKGVDVEYVEKGRE